MSWKRRWGKGIKLGLAQQKNHECIMEMFLPDKKPQTVISELFQKCHSATWESVTHFFFFFINYLVLVRKKSGCGFDYD